jgi:hypothetical protein
MGADSAKERRDLLSEVKRFDNLPMPKGGAEAGCFAAHIEASG